MHTFTDKPCRSRSVGFFRGQMKFVCVEVFRPIQPNGVMSSAVNLPNNTFTGQAKSSKRLTSIVHILSPETDNCPSWISGRERITVENISWSISTKECCRPRRGWTRDLLVQSDVHPAATEAGWETNWSGSTLFAKTRHVVFSKRRIKRIKLSFFLFFFRLRNDIYSTDPESI